MKRKNEKKGSWQIRAQFLSFRRPRRRLALFPFQLTIAFRAEQVARGSALKMAGHRFIIVACMLVLLASSFLSSSMSAQASSYPERILQRRLNAVKRAAQAGIRPGSEEASKEYVKQLFTDYLNKKKGELPPNPFANTTDLFTVIPGRY